MASSFPLAEADLESECPVCLEPFAPPVYQCINGHVICEACELQCQVCPMCRQPMPCQKVRSLQFEKILMALANTPTPCPKKGAGCDVIVKKKDMDDHFLECAFVSKKLCPQLGIKCNKEHCFSKMNLMIEHFIFDHNMNGSISDGDKSSTSKLELTETFTKYELNRLLDHKLFQPNFIRFDDKMFFVKKHVNDVEKMVVIMVCIDASLNTACKYSALIQLMPADKGMSVIFEFKQKEIALLSDAFEDDRNAPDFLGLCKIPFSTIEYYGKSADERCDNLSFKFCVSIFKNPNPALNPSPTRTRNPNTKASSSLSSNSQPMNTQQPRMQTTSGASTNSPSRARLRSSRTRPHGVAGAQADRGQEPLNPNSHSSSNSRARDDDPFSSLDKMFRRFFGLKK